MNRETLSLVIDFEIKVLRTTFMSLLTYIVYFTFQFHFIFYIIFLSLFKVMDIPLTVKMRTGISDKKTSWNAHKLISNLKTWGVSLATVSKLETNWLKTIIKDKEHVMV